METIWNILAIEPTDDERAIKRAYAARLKVHSPEADPAGYMKLRAAYDEAKRRAQMQRHIAELQFQPGEEIESVEGEPEAPAPEVVEPAAPAATPQQAAMRDLHELLEKRELEEFLKRLEEIKAAGVYPSLDDQYHFIGTVAVMIDDTSVEDSEWRGRVAEALGAREHENIFSDNAHYWHAYEALLRDYKEMRAARTRTHLDSTDDDKAAPGYLHVFHVLTAPFDAERLSALTRSQSYYRLAVRLLERAKSDASIVIPFENREWWERTAMAGYHRPIADAIPAPAPETVPETDSSSSGFPYWVLWIFFLLIVNGARSCSSTSSTTRVDPQLLEKYRTSVPMIIEHVVTKMDGYNKISETVALCDPVLRKQIMLHLYTAASRQRSSTDRTGPPQFSPDAPLLLPAPDPELTAMLEKCKQGNFLELDSQSGSQPPRP